MDNNDLYQLDILETDYLPVLKEKCKLFLKMLKGRKILEVGCGTGNLIKLLSSNNFELSGTDYSNDYIINAKKKNPNVDFFQGDLTDPAFWKKHESVYDSVICSEVLEHIEDDLTALRIVHSILKSDGTLIITVPAVGLLYSEFDKKIGHHRRYSMESASDVISQAGFIIEKARYWNFLGMFGWFILFRLLKQDIKKTSSPILGKILGSWLKIESKVAFPIGQTIMIHARKPKIE